MGVAAFSERAPMRSDCLSYLFASASGPVDGGECQGTSAGSAGCHPAAPVAAQPAANLVSSASGRLRVRPRRADDDPAAARSPGRDQHARRRRDPRRQESRVDAVVDHQEPHAVRDGQGRGVRQRRVVLGAVLQAAAHDRGRRAPTQRPAATQKHLVHGLPRAEHRRRPHGQGRTRRLVRHRRQGDRRRFGSFPSSCW